MGFNNGGAEALAERVRRARPWLPPDFVVGVSIGRGAATDDAAAEEDYLAAAKSVAPVADYLAINVSSPNTAGLSRSRSRIAWPRSSSPSTRSSRGGRWS